MAKKPKKPFSQKKPRPRIIERTPEKAQDLIVGKFKNMISILEKEHPHVPGKPPPFSTEILSFVKSDDTVTADLRIMSISKNVNIDSLLIDIHAGVDKTAVNGTWLSIGFYNPPNVAIESEEGYRRTQGMLFYRTHSRRWTKQHSAIIVEQARSSTDAFKKKHNRRPLGIVIRAWWNIEGRRPRYKPKPEEGEEG